VGGGGCREGCDLAKRAIRRRRPRARPLTRRGAGKRRRNRVREPGWVAGEEREQSKRFANGFHAGKALVLVSGKIQFSR